MTPMPPPNNKPNRPNDVLDRAVEALRSLPIPEAPPSLIAATVEAVQSPAPPRVALPLPARRQPLRRVLRYGAAAAAIVVAALAGLLWLMDRNASFSFAQVVANVNKAKTVSFTLRQRVGNDNELETKMLIRGDILRYEIPGALILILDTRDRKGIELNPTRKVAKKLDLTGAIPAEKLADPIDRLRKLKDSVNENVIQLADEEVDGRKCHVYEVKGSARAGPFLVPDAFKLWVDAKTALPVKIVAQDDDKLSLVYEQFRWDEPLHEELFSLALPPGYAFEELAPAVVRPGRIYYHQHAAELRSLQPDGNTPETQFVPRPQNSPSTYVSDRSELSPDGRYLAIAYTHITKRGAFPPYRVLLWDRTQPKDAAVEVYARPEGELQFWQFSPDGRRLYVAWWQGIPDRNGPDGRYGADVVDLATKAKQTLTLPKHKNRDGKEEDMLFAAASADGKTLLVIGGGLHAATADGKLLRRLSAADAQVIAAGVRLSPDSQQVLYTTLELKDRSHQLFAVSLAGGAPKQLVAGNVTDLRARWSPDGKRIAYTCRLLDPANPPFNHGNEAYLKRIDADGSDAVTLRTEKVHPKGPSLEMTAWR